MALIVINDLKGKKSKVLRYDDLKSGVVYINAVDPSVKYYQNPEDDDNIYITRETSFYTFKHEYDDIPEFLQELDISDSWEATDLELQISFTSPELFS